jgi:hypothetical protein
MADIAEWHAHQQVKGIGHQTMAVNLNMKPLDPQGKAIQERRAVPAVPNAPVEPMIQRPRKLNARFSCHATPIPNQAR